MISLIKQLNMFITATIGAFTIISAIIYGIWTLAIQFRDLQTHLVNIDNSVQDVSKKSDEVKKQGAARDVDIGVVQSTLTRHWTVIQETSATIDRVDANQTKLSDQLGNLELKLTGSKSNGN